MIMVGEDGEEVEKEEKQGEEKEIGEKDEDTRKKKKGVEI